ncbi:hypothetical protein [Amycolatopsis rifamycinica]|uniref:Uncharacterized protein n=1 Tax=Amycolatopsis rifamycinica TaxID=287986 RepID=A0A066U4X5_9PSEU|nr:hypothetical protein [Amycolatopsis rifamycinica]KDN20922.1 hypothetical protein DV20_17520 [Amycolatopsis rifamycinica]
MADDTSVSLAARYQRGTIIVTACMAGLWHGGFDTAAVLLMWPDFRWVWVSPVMWALYTAVLVAGTVQLLRDGVVRRPWLVVALTLTISVVVAVNADGAVVSFENWAFGAAGWLGVLASWGRSAAPLAVVLAGNGAASTAALFLLAEPDLQDVALVLTSLGGSAALQVALAYGVRTQRRIVDGAVEAATARAEVETRRLAAEQAHAARVRRHEFLQRTAAVVLAGLADGTSDPADPAVQRRCAIEAARLRRLFLEADEVPDPLLHEVRASLDVAEARGVPVRMSVSGALPAAVPVPVRRELIEPVIEVLSSARTHARVTISGGGGEVQVSVIADAGTVPAPRASGQVGVECQREGESLWVQTSWSGGSPSPSSKTTRS